MSENKKRIALAIVLAMVSVFLIAEASYLFFPSQDLSVDSTTSYNPLIVPIPTSPPGTPTNNQTIVNQTSPLLGVVFGQYANSTKSFEFNITQGETIKINVNFSSRSSDIEFTLPLYLSIGAFENKPSPQMIVSPPWPYPALPWPSHHDSPNASKPFDASFDFNPLTLQPEESKTSILTITALEGAQVGTYTMIVEMGNWNQTGLGGATFKLTVNSKY
jgi:hypothetical protein